MTEISRFDMIGADGQKDNRSSCSSTPEPYNYRHPMLTKLNGHSNGSGSGSGTGSSSSTVTVMTGGGGAKELNYCEVYYLSPSKRVYPVPCQKALNSHDMSWSTTATQKRRERLKSRTPPAEVGCHEPTQPTPSGDNFDMCSHYSDSAMQALRSGNSAAAATAATGAPPPRSTSTVTFSTGAGKDERHGRGSLRRSKGRSNQSLCSCDVGDEAEINLNPNRPLYQYSLERKSRTHTYTCEQNAQILMRLEREKNRKLGIATSDGVSDKQKDINQSGLNNFCDPPPFDYHDGTNSVEIDTTNEMDIIPPPPPPVSMNRKQQLKSLHDNIVKGYTTSPSSTTTTTTNNNLEFQSLLDDCTTTILNCANVGQHFAASQSVKPDLCRVTQQQQQKQPPIDQQAPLTARDDFYLPSSLSAKGKCPDASMYFYHQELPGYGDDIVIGRSMGGKYNTIGPNSHYAKQLATYHQQNNTTSCNLAQPDNNNLSSNGRYFSQSLSNFSFAGNGGGAHGHQHWYETGYQDGAFGRSPLDHHHQMAAATLAAQQQQPYKQCKVPTTNLGLSSCSFGETNHIHSSFTTLDSTNGGLKGKLQAELQTKKKTGQKQLLQQQQSQQFSTSTSSIMPWKHRQCPSRGSSSSGSNSLRFDAAKHWLAVSSILLIIGAASVAVPLALRVAASAPFEERLRVATQLLDQVPLIDGHNDLPWNIRKFLHNKLNDFNFDEDLSNVMPWARSQWSHTDLQRLKKGRVAAQFWAAYVPCEAQHRDAVQLTLEQIDVIKRLTERYSPQLTTCTSASDIIEAHKNHQLCSLTGVEGGHSLGGSLAVLRTLYAIGVRYMTLTSTCHTPWADSSYADAPTFNIKHGGLTTFGKTIIREMNRLGMIVDLSHVSTGTMRDALNVSEAPVIFSHSSAYELCNSSRNVQDDIMQALAKNGGLVMVNFYSRFLSCSDNSTVHDAVAHINHIKRVAGIDHVGLGAGFDGINFTPKGLEDVSTYPTLFAELLGVGWSMEDLTKLAGGNFLRVMTEVEQIRDTKKSSGVRPYEDKPNFRTEDPYNCTSS